MNVGDKAAGFELPDQTGKVQKLSDYRGRWVVVYFYPKDDTPGCTKEACGFRDGMDDLNEAGVVVGISRDSVESHERFHTKYALNFPLLSDSEGKVLEAYGAWQQKSMFGKSYMGIKRMTYLVDPEGKVAKVYEKVKPAEHAKEILEDIRKLKS